MAAPAHSQTLVEHFYTASFLNYSEDTKMATLKDVLESIEKSHNVSFFYKMNLIEGKAVPESVLYKESLSEEFPNILSHFGLTFKRHTDRTYLIMELNEPKGEEFAESFLQDEITGRVVDGTTGESLPGVNIIIEGTSIGVVTDIDGEYSIAVPGAESVIVFTYVGYVTQRITVGDQAEINVELEQDLSQLDEVVVVGYGTVRRADLTGAVSQVSAADFERVPATNPLMSLQGRTPGLRITPTSGEPGAGASIRIRGEQSISGDNSPIFVVDGSITTNIDNINSQDIESVSVLKDASAVAIYGSRAANGVILITTKRGSTRSAPVINLHTYGGFQHQSNLRLELLNAQEWIDIYTEAFENAGITPTWDQQTLAQYDGVDTDWMDVIMRRGYLSTVDLSVAGGSESSNYYISTSYVNNQGMVEELAYDRFNIRLNTDHVIRDRIKFGNSLNVFSSNTDGNVGQYRRALMKVPLTRVYEDDGDWGIIRSTTLEHQYSNPLWMARETVSDIEMRGLIGNIYLTIPVFEGLEFTTRYNLEWTNDYRTNFTPGADPRWQWEDGTINSVGKDNREMLHWITDFLLDFNRDFGLDHNITALLGYSREEQIFERLWSSGQGTPTNEIRFLSAADPTSIQSNNTFSDWSFASVFGRAGYIFRDRYILEGTIRRDGTSRLDSEHRYGVFPSISAAWRIGAENFMADFEWLNELKLRASWGTVGNVLSIGPYGTQTSLTNWNYARNQQIFQGYTLASAVNTDLRWESTEKKNFGIDVEMFDNRLYFITDFFIEDTRDLLFAQPLPMSAGLTGNPFINAGHIQNKGIEFDIGYREVVGNWRYSLSANLTHSVNEVIDLEGRDLRTSGIEEGYPLFSFFGYKTNGIIRTQEDLDNNPHFPGKSVGDIWFLDVNEDGSVTGDDRRMLASPYPDLTYGMMGTLGYRNWTLQLQLQGVHGITRDIRVGGDLGQLHYFTQFAKNHDRLILERFHPNRNPDGDFPKVALDDSGSNLNVPSDFWLRDASYLRISNVNINYDFSTSFIEQMGMSNLSAYVSVQNLYTITNFYGPEVDTMSDVLTGVPQPRTWTVGLRVGF